MWNYDTITLQLKRGIEKFKKRNTPILPRDKRSSNLEKVQFEYLKLQMSENKMLFRDYEKNKMSGDMLALLTYALKDSRFENYSFVWVASSFWEVLEIKEMLKERDRERVQFVALDSIQFRKALEMSGIIITACSLPKYFIKRENQTIISLFGFKSLLGLFQDNNLSAKKITNVLSLPNKFLCPLLDRNYGLVRDIGQYSECEVSRIDSYPRFELSRINHGCKIIFSYRSESFYRCTLNTERFQDWIDTTIAALSSEDAPFGVCVSGDFYDVFPRGANTKKCKVLSFSRGLSAYLFDADLLITDYPEDLYVAQQSGKDYIYVGDQEKAENVFSKLGLSLNINLSAKNHIEVLELLKNYPLKQRNNSTKTTKEGVCEQIFNEIEQKS